MAYTQYSHRYVAQEEYAKQQRRGIHAGRFIPPWRPVPAPSLRGERESPSRGVPRAVPVLDSLGIVLYVSSPCHLIS